MLIGLDEKRLTQTVRNHTNLAHIFILKVLFCRFQPIRMRLEFLFVSCVFLSHFVALIERNV